MSYALCAYAWHKYRVCLDIQALQFSFLGGRIFFKGLRYHGHNETILVYDGYVTWRYWLRRVRPLQWNRPAKDTSGAATSHSADHNNNSGQEGEAIRREPGANKSAPILPCRIAMKARGIEWFIYNRSPAYDTILRNLAETEISKDADVNEKVTRRKFHSRKHIIQTDVSVNKISHEVKKVAGGSHENEQDRKANSIFTTDSSEASSESTSTRDHSKTDFHLPKIVNLFPIKIECSKGAIVMGNENTRSILTAKFDSAVGHIEARNSRLVDSYKQSINVDFIHPIIRFKTNKDFKETLIAEGAIHKFREEAIPISNSFRDLWFNFKARLYHTWKLLRVLNPFSRGSAVSLAQGCEQSVNDRRHPERNTGVPGQSHWLGLTRYLDGDDDIVEQERWKTIEYGQFPTILDSPKIEMSFYWDVPGLVPKSNSSFSRHYLNSEEDINGDSPPDWGVDLRIVGGNIRYGPWADRQRADLQAVFFPSLRKDAVPAVKLEVGQPRVSTVFKLVIDIEEQTTIGVPTREGSKDWKWKGRETTSIKPESEQKNKKLHSKRKKDKKASEASEVRPFGWLDIKFFQDSTISFTMDLVAGSKGFINRIDLDIRGPEISTSVNHGLLWRSKSQKISCDLSYPLKWNEIHSWNFDIQSESPEIFLIRDHIFLLTDLVDDWTSGPSEDFYSFVPYHYSINLGFQDFQLHINANDANIINNPSDTDDNTFTIIHGKILSVALAIPSKVFRPTYSQIEFDINGHDGGIKLHTPPWNTYRTFLDNSDVASLKELKVKGSYDYFNSTSPGLTDVLTLNMHVVGLKLYLHGFFVRYLIIIKDNYFGDDLHFRTLEEYQAQAAREMPGNESTVANHYHRFSNDLDVILAIAVDHPCILLPSQAYSSNESISMDISSIGIDLRFTNYYMDLAVAFGPIAISYISLQEDEDAEVGAAQSTQVFVNSFEISGHRLFGLPPSEPTYICNWDFGVGSVSGECCPKFLQCLILALRSFAFTFEDAENALACAHSQVIHDITFLRARIQPVSLWLRLDKVALLLTLKDLKISYDDLAKQLISGRLSMTVPSLALALVNVGGNSTDKSSLHSSAITNAFFETSIDVKIVKQSLNFQRNRQLQQSHISLQDARTNRIPWLIEEFGQPKQVGSSRHCSKIKSPAMPFPAMPEPVSKTGDLQTNFSSTSIEDAQNYNVKGAISRKASFLTACSIRQGRARFGSSDISFKSQHKKAVRDESRLHSSNLYPAMANTWHKKRSSLFTRHSNSLQTSKITQLKERRARLHLSFSSPYKKPHFPLFNMKLDASMLPELPENDQSHIPLENVGTLEVGKAKLSGQDLEQSSFILYFNHGISGFLLPAALQNINLLLMALQSSNANTLMDILQIDAMTEDFQALKRRKGHKIYEFRCIIPYTEIRFSNIDSSNSTINLELYQFDLSLGRIVATARSNENSPDDTKYKSQSQSSINLLLSKLQFLMRRVGVESSDEVASIQLTMNDIVFRMLMGVFSKVDLGFSDFNFGVVVEDVGSIASFLQNAQIATQRFLHNFSAIREKELLRLRFLVLFLSRNGDKTPDPPFLTRASYLMRSATSHLRTLDSWKMMSRLRYIHQSLPNNLRDQIREQLKSEKLDCPENASVQVAASFGHWHTWDVIHVRQSRLLRKVYGTFINAPDDHPKGSISFQAILRAGRMRIFLGLESNVNEIILERLTLDIAANLSILATGRDSSTNSLVISSSTIQTRCFKAVSRINWDLLHHMENVYRNLKILPKSPSTKRENTPFMTYLTADSRLHIMASLETTVLSLDAKTLKCASTYQGLTASFVLDPTANADAHSANAIVNAKAMNLIIQRQSRSIALLNLKLLTFLGSQDLRLETKSRWKLASYCDELYFEVLEEPLGLLEITKLLLRDELEEIIILVTKIGELNQPQSPIIHSDWQKVKDIDLSIFLGRYFISFNVLSSLIYSVSGAGIQCLMLHKKREMSEFLVDFDVKAHFHVFTKRGRNLSDVISSLSIPSINGRYKMDLSSIQKLAILQIAVENINVDASALHTLLTTLYRPEIKTLATNLGRDFAIVKMQSRKHFTGYSTIRGPSSLQKPTQYDGHVTLAGFVIHVSTQEPTAAAGATQFQINVDRIKLQATNTRPDLDGTQNLIDLQAKSKHIKAELRRLEKSELYQCGHVSLELVLESKITSNERNQLVHVYQIRCHNLDTDIYPQTASMVLDILSHLQNRLKTIDVPMEVKSLRRLTLGRLRSETPLLVSTNIDTQEPLSSTLVSDMYSIEVTQIRVTWKIEPSLSLSPDRQVEDLILSFTKIDLATRTNNAARLLIEDFQLQMLPRSKALQGRSPNSALLPEVVFNVAYLSTATDRRLAFQAVGKPLDLRLTTQFILPASDLRRSIAIAVQDVRRATAAWNASSNEGINPRRKMLGKKRLASLLIDADFAGAVVHIQGRMVADPHTLALTVLKGGRLPQQGRYGQFQENANSKTTLRAPGIALKVEYKDMGIDEPSLNAEFKVHASSNILYPMVVPLIMEISSSVKEIVGEPDKYNKSPEPKPPLPKLLDDERLRTADPSTIFGKCRLNLGLQICRQDFSLSCQPIARVATTAFVEAIYITLNTIQSAENGQFFTLSASFDRLKASVQHVYSRDSTGSLEINSVVLSVMNSKHVSAGNGMSAILKISPVKVQINARQLHDFLLFREIWAPLDLRRPSPPPELTPSSEPQAFIVQRYQQVAAASSFPWNATVSIAELDIQLELGQSLGKSTFVISNFWVSSKKNSEWEQNLCLGFANLRIDSVGRLSGSLELQDFRVRTSIHWPVESQTRSQAPLIQASVGFDHLRVKAAFDFQTFLIADITVFEFLMYNVRDSRQAHGDRLVGVLDGEKVQIFSTTTSTAQGLALYQTFERLVQEKKAAYEMSLKDIEKYLRRRSSAGTMAVRTAEKKEQQEIIKNTAKAPLQLRTNVIVNLKAVNIGAFPSTFFDNQIFKVEALNASARFAVVLDNGKLHSTLGMTLGQLRVALSSVSRANASQPPGEVSVVEVVANATGSRGGTILKVPRLVATMQTWQIPESSSIEYIFGSSFQGKVDVGWNYSRISFLRGMWTAHTRAVAQRLGKPLPPSALQITGGLFPEEKDGVKPSTGNQEKITAVVNVPQSKFLYTALQPPIIETPQLRDMGEATPPLEWIGLHRDRLPNLTHQIVIVSLLELAKEVEDAYQRILGTSSPTKL